MSKMTAERRRIPASVSATALGVTTALALSFGATSAWASNEGAAASTTSYLKVFSDKATAEDELPREADGTQYAEGTNLIYETARLLGADSTAKYWAVAAEPNSVCLVTQLVATKDSSMVCTAAETFGRKGVAGTVQSNDGSGEEIGYREAYLVPDSLRFATTVDGLSQASQNLIVGDTRGAKEKLVASTIDGRAELNIQLLHPDPNL